MNAPADRMPTEGKPVNPPSGNAAMRYLFLFVLGLVVGVIGTVMAVRALDARKDHFPESVMHLFAAHMDMLDANVSGNRCRTAVGAAFGRRRPATIRGCERTCTNASPASTGCMAPAPWRD
jgi:hypothetical protein